MYKCKIYIPIAYWGTWLHNLFKPSPGTMHYLLTHFSWIWAIVNNVGFINDYIMTKVYTSKSHDIAFVGSHMRLLMLEVSHNVTLLMLEQYAKS